MSNLVWDDCLSVGNPQLDEDHRQLFALFNRLCQALEDNQPAGHLETLLVELLGYSERHFAAEEIAMQQSDFDGYSEHIAEHETLYDKVAELRKRLADGERKLALELGIFLQEWLLHHVKVEDQKF